MGFLSPTGSSPFARGEWVHAVSALVEGCGKAAPRERRQRALMEGEGCHLRALGRGLTWLVPSPSCL